MAILKTIIYQHNAAIMMMTFHWGAKRGWCGNTMGQVDMCQIIFQNRIVQECFKIVNG